MPPSHRPFTAAVVVTAPRVGGRLERDAIATIDRLRRALSAGEPLHGPKLDLRERLRLAFVASQPPRGCPLMACIVSGKHVAFAWQGDCTAYVIRDASPSAAYEVLQGPSAGRPSASLWGAPAAAPHTHELLAAPGDVLVLTAGGIGQVLLGPADASRRIAGCETLVDACSRLLALRPSTAPVRARTAALVQMRFNLDARPATAPNAEPQLVALAGGAPREGGRPGRHRSELRRHRGRRPTGWRAVEVGLLTAALCASTALIWWQHEAGWPARDYLSQVASFTASQVPDATISGAPELLLEFNDGLLGGFLSDSAF